VDGFYDVTICIQNPSQCRHLHFEIALLHYRIGPNSADELFFCDEGARRPDQHHKKIEGATAELDGLSVDQQLAGSRQYAELAKPNDGVAAYICLVPAGARRILVADRLVGGVSRAQ
jgi:hypothetical protein